MNLKDLLGDELYAQVQQKIDDANANEEDKSKHIRYADLSEGGYVARAKYDALEKAKEDVEGQLKTAEGTIRELKKSNEDNSALQEIIKTHEATIASLKAEADKTNKTYALKDALSKAGAIDPDYLIYRQGGYDKFKFDKEGKPEGLDNLINGFKEDKNLAHIFRQQGNNPNYTPENGTPVDFSKMNYTQMCEYLVNNPGAEIPGANNE